MIPKLSIWALNDTLRRVGALNGTPRQGRETCFKRHPPTPAASARNLNSGFARGHVAQGRGLVRTVFETCRGVPFKGHKSTVGCCLKEASEIGGGPGRKGGGGEGKPSPLQLFNTRRWVGEFFLPCCETRFSSWMRSAGWRRVLAEGGRLKPQRSSGGLV